jgi:hypothetical protein
MGAQSGGLDQGALWLCTARCVGLGFRELTASLSQEGVCFAPRSVPFPFPSILFSW